MADIVDTAMIRRASIKDATNTRAPSETGLMPLTSIAMDPWRKLSEAASEPNAYYLPGWERAVNAFASGRTGASALAAWSGDRLIGLMPLVSLWHAYRIPLPALVSAHPYGTLCAPPLDRALAPDAAAKLMQQARDAGAHALILRDMSLDGAAMNALADVLRRDGIAPRILQSNLRACLDATRDSGELLLDALGAKKLKELRRQRHRLAEHGAVAFEIARSPDEIAAAVETFLRLEASGWKGARGTALLQNDGDTNFVRHATAALATTGQCEIITLRTGDVPVAAGIVLRHLDRAFFFKIGVDQRFAKFSPGVQLTLDLTCHLCADPAIASADSTASPDHPMINPIWRGRFAIGDVLIPLRTGDPVVPVIHAALIARQTALTQARGAVHFIRKLKSA